MALICQVGDGLLSQAIGRITVEEEVDLKKMREVVDEEASKHILSKGFKHE